MSNSVFVGNINVNLNPWVTRQEQKRGNIQEKVQENLE